MRKRISSFVTPVKEGTADHLRPQAVQNITSACKKEFIRWQKEGATPLSKKGAKAMVRRALGNTGHSNKDILQLCFDSKGDGTYEPLQNMHEHLIVLMKL